VDDKKKGKLTPDESWVKRLLGDGDAPSGVITYVGLVRETPGNDRQIDIYLTLDMRSCIQVQRADVVFLENLTPEQSPFGSLGGSRVYVKLGAQIKSVRTVTKSVEAGAADEFDLDIRLGARASVTGIGGNQTIPNTGCGADCETIPPFSDPDVGGCVSVPQTICNCSLQCTIDTCVCVPTRSGKTCGANCQITRALTCNTCETNCGTCATNCGTCATNCGTCATHCGTCRVNTCNTKCGQETCVACTHIFTQCNQHGCGVG
jgi:hypothetical protein